MATTNDHDADSAHGGGILPLPRNRRVPLQETFDLCSELITIAVGSGDKTSHIRVHRDVLSRNSEFFKRAIKPEWSALREEPDTIDLSIHSVDDVKTYAHWLYSGTIPTRDFDGTGESKSDPTWIDLASAYVFGEKMMDRKYQTAILETIAAVQTDAPDFPCAEAFIIIYDGTPEGSPARKLLADMYGHGAYDAPDWKEALAQLPQEALVDVIQATVRVREELYHRPWTLTVQSYIDKEGS